MIIQFSVFRHCTLCILLASTVIPSVTVAQDDEAVPPGPSEASSAQSVDPNDLESGIESPPQGSSVSDASVSENGDIAPETVETVSDPAFARYFDEAYFQECIESLNYNGIVDNMLGLLEAERVYKRDHIQGITSDSVFSRVVPILHAGDHKAELERLRKAGEEQKKSDWVKTLDGLGEFESSSRSSADGSQEGESAGTDLRNAIAYAELTDNRDLMLKIESALKATEAVATDDTTSLAKQVTRALKRIEERQPSAEVEAEFDAASRGRTEQYLEGAMSGVLERALLIELSKLPPVQSSNNWGKQVNVACGTTTERYKIKGPFGSWTWGYRPAVKYCKKNHGEWTKSWVRVENARDSLDVKFRDVRKTASDEIRFQIYASCMFRGQAEFRAYSHGAQLVSVTANGRARGHVYIDMRVRVDFQAGRISYDVTGADIKYSDVVMDRVGHFGGTTAKLLGDAFTGAVRQWFPDKEREALQSAKDAIIRSIRGDIDLRNALANAVRRS
ncbi:hypothetical protein [Roseiconus lacunae]|uniref:Uncharacterized protein n=1 Tax=Roseiconus lacunae TaxID=2605694 RepID=A0ABT7PS55_9BACT|nr:hypothetical protein [Roseiconus lacunae]MDM4019333.1 hypothetical protein [Roseiconus lacunae]